MLNKILTNYDELVKKNIIPANTQTMVNYYLSYSMKKSNGKNRWIDAPLEPLKSAQEDILYNFLYKLKPHPAAVGFVSDIGIEYGAERHLGNNVLLNMDLKDFFPSIRIGHLRKFIKFVNARMSKKIFKNLNSKPCLRGQDINDFINLVLYKGCLPQGSPCSPAISNIIAYGMDKKLQKFADHYELTYTRYADDLSFSHSDKNFPLQNYIGTIDFIIRQYNFKTNKSKTRIMRPHQRMSVTGVVINEKLSVPRWKWRNFRAKLHNLKTSGKYISKLEWQQLKGYCEWIKNLHPRRGQKFLTELGKIPHQK